MPEAIFVRLPDTLAELVRSIDMAEKNGASKMRFRILHEIYVDMPIFLELTKNLKRLPQQADKFREHMQADEYGAWLCLLVSSRFLEYSLVFYTGGHSVPLYGSIMKKAN